MAQPNPIKNDSTPIWALVQHDYAGRDPRVLVDMIARDKLGRERYGVPLQANNGRDALRDAYEEALDLAAYLRQGMEETDNSALFRVALHYSATLDMLASLRDLL